ncbi:hypothetical protein MN608_06814 [Microdochium nivale]|nr:hypothetical protein MN608_06814 [Microdochium nivale]
MAKSALPLSAKRSCKIVLPRNPAVPATFRFTITPSLATPTQVATLRRTQRSLAALRALNNDDRLRYKALIQRLHDLLIIKDTNLENDICDDESHDGTKGAHPSSRSDSGSGCNDAPTLDTLTSAALRLSERSQEVNRLMLQCCELRVRILRNKTRIAATSRTVSQRQGCGGVGGFEVVCECASSSSGDVEHHCSKSLPAADKAACRQDRQDVSEKFEVPVVTESTIRGVPSSQTRVEVPATTAIKGSIVPKTQSLEITGQQSDLEAGTVMVGASYANARPENPVQRQQADVTAIIPKPGNEMLTYSSPLQPTTAFTDMLDINEPRYIVSPADLCVKRGKLCRSVVISNIPNSIDTLSAVLARVRGGMVVRARLVDMTHWPAACRRDASVTSSAPCRRLAYVEFADPREAHAYVEYVNNLENAGKGLLLWGRGCHNDTDTHRSHRSDSSHVRVQLAQTPSYPLPAWLHRVIQNERASRNVVVRYQQYDRQDHIAADAAATGEIVEKCMDLITQRFLSSWPYHRDISCPTKGARGGQGERYALLESAWIEQEATQLETSIALAHQRDTGIDDEDMQHNDSPKTEMSGNSGTTSIHDHHRTARVRSTTTTFLHLGFCKIEHAIRAASALRYQIHATSGTPGAVTVGFGKDECAGDIDELLQDTDNPEIAQACLGPAAIPATTATTTTRVGEDVATRGKRSSHSVGMDKHNDNKLSILQPWRAGFLGELLEDNFAGYTAPLRRQLATVQARCDDSAAAAQRHVRHNRDDGAAASTGDLLGLSDTDVTDTNASSPAGAAGIVSPPSIWSTFAAAVASSSSSSMETEYSVTCSTPTSPLGAIDDKSEIETEEMVAPEEKTANEPIAYLVEL